MGETHPSYGQIGFSRTSSSGNRRLYGTSINHRNTIRLEIKESEVRRDLNRYWYFAPKTIIEVEMSQNQFAELVSSFNMGDGVPCTITRRDGELVDPPPCENVRDVLENEFQDDIDRNLARTIELIEKAEEMLSQKKAITKAQMHDLEEILFHLKQDLQSNLKFVMQSFNKQVNKSVTEAKGEIEAFVETKVRSYGIEHLKKDAQVSLPDEMTKELPDGQDNHL